MLKALLENPNVIILGTSFDIGKWKPYVASSVTKTFFYAPVKQNIDFFSDVQQIPANTLMLPMWHMCDCAYRADGKGMISD